MIADHVLSFVPTDPGAEVCFDILPRMQSTVPLAAAPSEPDAQDQENSLRGMLIAIARRDEATLEAFYDLTVGRVYGLALRITRRPEAAEEVASDVYLQIWRDAARYDPSRGRVLTWLLTVCRSRAIDSLRRRDEAESLPEDEELNATDTVSSQPEELLATVQNHTALHRALELLTPLQRQLLALAFFRGLTHEEIAQRSQLPLGSVKTHVRKALGILRAHLGDGTLENRA